MNGDKQGSNIGSLSVILWTADEIFQEIFKFSKNTSNYNVVNNNRVYIILLW